MLALDQLLAGKMFFFAAHRITRTGRSGSGPKKRSSMDSSPAWTDVAPEPGFDRHPAAVRAPAPAAAFRSMFAASHSAITLSASHAWELQSWQGSSRAMPVEVSRIV